MDIEALSATAAARAEIRRRLQAGVLPRVRPDAIWGSRGTGVPCDCCGRGISALDVMYELDFKSGPALRMHLPCYQAWRDETDA
jgi:hypothetical protein